MHLLSREPAKAKAKAKPRKTHAQVKADLFTSIVKEVNTSLDIPIELDEPPSPRNLQTIFAQLASKKFEQEYGYPYDSGDSKPRNQAPHSSVLFAAGECCILGDDVSDKSKATEHFVVEKIFHRDSLPGWMLNAAKESVVTQCSNLVKLSTFAYKPSSAPFVKNYSRDSSEGKYLNSVHTDAVFLYENASLEEDGVKAHISVLYYMGIYYETVSPQKAAQLALFDSIYDNARKMLAHPSDAPLPPSEDNLAAVLRLYKVDQFKQYFGFNFDDPDSIPSTDSDKRSYHTSALLSYSDCDRPPLERDIAAQIISSLPSWVPNQGSREIDSAIKACLQSGQHDGDNNWRSEKIESTFSTGLDCLPVIHKAGLVWCDARVSGLNDVSYKFILYFGLFYEIPNGQETARSDLIRSLWESACALLPQPQPVPNNPSTEDLNGILIAASREEFKKAFKFPFNGSETRLPEALDGSPIYAAQLTFNESSVEDTSTEQFVTSILKSFQFPELVAGSALLNNVQMDLLSEVEYCLEMDTSNTIRVSSAGSFTAQYDYDDDISKKLSMNALFICSNASMPDPIQGTDIEMHIIHYIGISYNVTGDGSQ